MDAIKAAIGERYLSKRGTPVTVVGHKGDKVVLKIKGSENEIEVARTYELKPFKESEVSKEAKALESANGKAKMNGHPKAESLAASIDPLLFGGKNTVREIAEAVAKKLPDLSKGRDMEANVRARMVSFSRKGWKIERDDHKHVKVTNSKS